MKAIKLNVVCQHCGKEATAILTKANLEQMLGALKVQELLKDLSLGKNKYAQGVDLNVKTVGELMKNVNRKPYTRR